MGKKSENYNQLRQLRDWSVYLLCQEPEENPSLFVFNRFIQLFQEFDLPVQHVGKIDVTVDASFFESKQFANDILYNMVEYFRKIYDMILENVGGNKEVADQIFGDYLDVNIDGLEWVNDNSSSSIDNDQW